MSDFIPHWEPPPPGDDSFSRCDGVTGYEIEDAIEKEDLGNAMDRLIYGNSIEKMETSEDEIDSLPELSENDFSGESPPLSSLSSLSMDQQGMGDVNTEISSPCHQGTLAKDAALGTDREIQYGSDTLAESGPTTLRGVVIKRRDSDSSIQFPNRRTGSRLTSGSSSGSSLKDFKTRRTQKEMKAMTKEEKRELQKSQHRANFKNSLQKKKNKKASLEEHSKDLDVELRGGLESLEQLEAAYKEKFPDSIARKNNMGHLIEKENQDCRKKLEEEVRKLEIKLKGIAKEKTLAGIKKTSNASAKCRTKLKLEIASLELKVHQQETKIVQMDMIIKYLKEALGVKSMEGDDNQQLLTGSSVSGTPLFRDSDDSDLFPPTLQSYGTPKQSADSISRQCHRDTNIANYINFNGNSEGFSNSIPVDCNKEVFDNQMDSTGGPMLTAEEQSATLAVFDGNVSDQTIAHQFDDFSINQLMEQYDAKPEHPMDTKNTRSMISHLNNSTIFNCLEGTTERLIYESAPPLNMMTENSNCPVPQFGESAPMESNYLQGQYNYARIPSKDPYSPSMQETANVSDQSSAQWTLPLISTIFTNSEPLREATPAISSAGMGMHEFVGNGIGWNQPPGFPDNQTMVSSSGLPYPNSGKSGQQYDASSSNTITQNTSTNYVTMQEQSFSTSRSANDGYAHHFHTCDPIFGCTDGYNNGSESMPRITDNSDNSQRNFCPNEMTDYIYGNFVPHGMSDHSLIGQQNHDMTTGSHYGTPDFVGSGSIPDKYSEI
ncbi:hypothetical protein L3Y34_014991 [Caenorhabditis briggsae]|uniref:Uncharacterized protein n=1 Tax=Caenorhabditis briggsae TaxID=6238 RepID=A0AAE9IYB3_CAEBR|nr:hypothetical protein L3Y34_014991 [Caenorhabditis briggsae]